MIDEINDFLELKRELSKWGIIDVYHDSFGTKEALMFMSNGFYVLSHDKEVAEIDRDCDEYPYELSFEMGGIKFVTLATFEEYYTYKHKKIAAATATKERIDI